MRNILKPLGITLVIFFGLNFLASNLHFRFDLTRDNRYTLSEESRKWAREAQVPVVIDVLLEGDLPSEFRRLQDETRVLLTELKALNPKITFEFVDPLDEENRNAGVTPESLMDMGLQPASVTTEESASISQQLVYPWAVVSMGESSVSVPLLKNTLGASMEERINNSVRSLEYGFTDALYRLQLKDRKTMAVLKGNGELEDRYLADFLTSLGTYYHLAPFTMDSVATAPERTWESLREFDMILVAKPTEPFSEEEKLLLDQYQMYGGKSLWMLDMVGMELDSLFAQGGQSIALGRDLGINDLLFSYGVRVNTSLVADLYATQIVLATSEGRDAQYTPAPWVYAPLVLSREDHPVNKNISGVRFRFANPIDTISNRLKKTVLLASSPLSRIQGTPSEVNLDIVETPPNREAYAPGNYPLAVLIEGDFPSVYRNRIKPMYFPGYRSEGAPSAMIVVGDGDLASNDLQQGRPLELGYDKWTGNYFGNKEFLMNAVHYLIGDDELINIRAKEVKLALLDKAKIEENGTTWKLLNTGLPLVLLAVLQVVFWWWRKRKFAR